ncbi:helix-turn-helix transcriptional regulator [Alteromonadaceae bacterium BrNp21-10]|nr:helix-turn-helix transcriptional regulator [Alteromonadaceae bacterium BrNp21-10]
MPIDADRLLKLTMELRRGALVLAVLSALQNEHYGYSLRKQLSDLGLDIDEGTLYPLMRRLETQGLLVSHWREEQGRKRRFYQIAEDGKEALLVMTQEWQKLNAALSNIAPLGE